MCKRERFAIIVCFLSIVHRWDNSLSLSFHQHSFLSGHPPRLSFFHSLTLSSFLSLLKALKASVSRFHWFSREMEQAIPHFSSLLSWEAIYPSICIRKDVCPNIRCAEKTKRRDVVDLFFFRTSPFFSLVFVFFSTQSPTIRLLLFLWPCFCHAYHAFLPSICPFAYRPTPSHFNSADIPTRCQQTCLQSSNNAHYEMPSHSTKWAMRFSFNYINNFPE